MNPRLAIVTLQDAESWYCFVAWVLFQGDLIAGHEASSGEWFQFPVAQATVSFDPLEVVAW